MTPTLLGYLAKFDSFSAQSEVLCTQGLTYLLQNYGEARSALADEVEARTSVQIDDSLEWLPEALQADGGRPDLEARTVDGVPVAKIEAKLGAELGAGQLESYVGDLRNRNGDEAALLVLVPKSRVKRVSEEVSATFGSPDSGLWRIASGESSPSILIAVISWDELFDKLREAEEPRFLLELEQLQAMYLVLSGDYIAPLANDEDLLEWSQNKTNYINMVDQVTRQLTTRVRILPMVSEAIEEASPESEPGYYRLRYVCPEDADVKACFSIGARDSFAEWVTPIWMRFHRGTGDFGPVRQRIEASSLRSLESGGHIWIPLDPPREVSGGVIIQNLIEQAEEVMCVAYQRENPDRFI